MNLRNKIFQKKVVSLFNKNIKGKFFLKKRSHWGEEGHWLEKQIGILPNSKNQPDIYGFEMKSQTSSKTTFGDWSASYYIFKNKKNFKSNLTRNEFLRIFGKLNQKKGRFSWSGEPIPKINSFSNFGQILKIRDDYSLVILYFYTKDQRSDKKSIVPRKYQKNNLILAKWTYSDLKNKVERKFNQRGWFKCIKDNRGVYQNIVFGAPLNIQKWLYFVSTGDIFFDSGMYQGNNRNYSHWRAKNSFWKKLIIKKY